MTKKTFQSSVAVTSVTLIVIILALVPFHAFLTVWAASGLGHYTLLRLWKEFLLLIIVGGAGYLLWRNPKVYRLLSRNRLVQLSCLYIALTFIWGIVAYALHAVTLKAMAYGFLINTRYLFLFLAVWVITSTYPGLKKQWRPVVIIPAIIVIIVALLQYFVLPYDFLKHFGYNQNTIFPYEDINHNVHYLRVMSTLRGANPLGAYMVLVLSLLLAIWAKTKKQWQLAIFPAVGLLTLVLSFSRGAWIGFVVSAAIILFVSLRSERLRQLGLIAAGVAVIIAAGLTLALRHNTTFENTFFHTEDRSNIATSSNEGHSSALKAGVKDMVHDPFGRGPGSAGQASVYNGKHGVRIAENYFIQIGQEMGWIGFVLFIFINILLAQELWHRRNQSLALGLFAALIGLSIVNMFSHAWSDDTLAYMFWGLAGLALATNAKTENEA